MKKILNHPEKVVQDMCNGIVQAYPGLELLPKYKVIKRKELNPNKVSLISGGGSGHEPAHAGFVGEGMLDAAVCGDVFASPSQIQVYQAIKALPSSKGVLLIIKNYSGDMMNFQNAAYMAQEDGIEVDYVKVDDDIAVQDSLYTVGRRGVAGTVFVHKIAGAAAEQGKSLAETKKIAEKAIANIKSIGFALSSCTVPAKGTPTFALAEKEMEYGVGIHGEPGIQREELLDAATLAKRMTSSLCEELQLKNGAKEPVALMINGFGATPLMELYVLTNDIKKEFSQRGILVKRVFVGNYMTSIDMAGASLSVLKLDDELESLLNEKCDTPALKVDGALEAIPYSNAFEEEEAQENFNYGIETPKEFGRINAELDLNNLHYIVDVMSDSIIRNEIPFCELDAHAGDGDFGMSVAKGFRQLKREWKEILAQSDDMGSFLDACSMVIMEHCGGASGPIWGSAFRAAGKAAAGKKTLTVAEFADVLQAAVAGIQKTGERSFGRGAVLGDKTLIDALIPCADSWQKSAEEENSFSEAFRRGADAAIEGAKATEQIVAKMGRAGNVGKRSIGYPDAGAHALGVIFTDIANAIYQ